MGTSSFCLHMLRHQMSAIHISHTMKVCYRNLQIINNSESLNLFCSQRIFAKPDRSVNSISTIHTKYQLSAHSFKLSDNYNTM